MSTNQKRVAMFSMVSLVTILIVSVALPAFAARELRFAHVYEIKTPYHEAALKAAEEVAEQTNGRYTIKVFAASSLGKEQAINEGISLGTIDIIYTGCGFASRSFGPIGISDYPFTMRGYPHWKAYTESDLFAELSEGYKEATGGAGVDVAIEISGAYAALQQAIRCVHREGLVVAASYYGDQTGRINLAREWHHNRITLRSGMPVWGCSHRWQPMWDFSRLERMAITLLEDRRLRVGPLIGARFRFERAVEAYARIDAAPGGAVKILLTYERR